MQSAAYAAPTATRDSAQSLTLSLSLMAKDAQKAHLNSLVAHSELLWNAASAFKAKDDHAAKVLIANFLSANQANPYLRRLMDGTSGGTSASGLSASDQKIVDEFNVAFQGPRLQAFALKLVYQFSMQIERSWNSLNPATPGADGRAHEGLGRVLGWAASLGFGRTGEIETAKKRVDAALEQLEKTVRSNSPRQNLQFLKSFGALANEVEATQNAIAKKYDSVPYHAQLIAAQIESFQKTGKFFSLRNLSSEARQHPELPALMDRIVSLQNQIRAHESGEESARIYWEATELSVEMTGTVILIAASVLAMPVPGMQAFAATGVGTGISLMGALAGVAYTGVAAAGMADQASEGKAGFETREDWERFGMNGIMLLSIAGSQLPVKTLAARLASTSAKAAKAVKAVQLISTGANAAMLVAQGRYSAYEIINADAIAQQTGLSITEVRTQGVLNLLMAMLGGVNVARETVGFVRQHPSEIELATAKYANTETAAAAVAVAAPAEDVHAPFSNLFDRLRATGNHSAVDEVVAKIGEFERGFMSKRSEQTPAKAQALWAGFNADAQKLRAEAADLLDVAKANTGDTAEAKFNLAGQKKIAAELYEAAARAAAHVGRMLPVYAQMDQLETLAATADQLLTQAAKAEYKADPTGATKLYGQATDQLNQCLQGCENILRSLEKNHRVDSAEYKDVEILKADLKDRRDDALADRNRVSAKATATNGSGSAANTGGSARTVPLDAFKGLTKEVRERLEHMVTDNASRETLDMLVARRLSEARAKGISEEAFNLILARAVSRCVR